MGRLGSVFLVCLALVGPVGPARATDADTLTVATMWEALPLSMTARRSRFFNESEILDTLVKLDFEMNLIPGLATKWEQTGPTDWVFSLREGVRFHDGSRLDAQAVKASFERLLALLPFAPAQLDIAGIDVLAPLSVRIRTNEPFAGLPNQLTDAFTGVYGQASFDATGAFVQPVGTGPYRFVSYDKQDRTVVERFDGYWGPPPTIRRVVFRSIPDHNTRTLALEAGEVDMAVNILPSDAVRLTSVPGIEVHRQPTAGLYYAVFNTRDDSPLGDVRVRRALNVIIDRADLVQYGLDGVGLPAWQFFSPVFDWVPETLPRYAVDLTEAARLLTDAGYTRSSSNWTKDGQPLTLRLLSYASRTEMQPITEAVSAMLRAAGIQVDIDLHTWGGMLTRVKQGDFDAYVVFWTPEMTGHPDLHLTPHFHSAQNLLYNGYVNGMLDDLLVKGRGLPLGTERQETYRRALTLIHEDAPIAPLVHKVAVSASSDRVEGYRIHPSGFFYNFKEVRLAAVPAD